MVRVMLSRCAQGLLHLQRVDLEHKNMIPTTCWMLRNFELGIPLHAPVCITISRSVDIFLTITHIFGISSSRTRKPKFSFVSCPKAINVLFKYQKHKELQAVH